MNFISFNQIIHKNNYIFALFTNQYKSFEIPCNLTQSTGFQQQGADFLLTGSRTEAGQHIGFPKLKTAYFYSFTCISSNILRLVTCTDAPNAPQTHPDRYNAPQTASVPALLVNRPELYSTSTPAAREIPAAHRTTCSNISIHRARFFVTPRTRRSAASFADCMMTRPGPNRPMSTAAVTATGKSSTSKSRTRLILSSAAVSM